MPLSCSVAIRPRLAAGVAGLALLAVVALAVGSSLQVRAGPPPAVTALDPTAAERAGVSVALSAASVAGETAIEAVGPAAGPPVRLLAVAPDGQAAAISSVDLGQVGPLTIARNDGSQLRVEVPGVSGAAFEPSGAWLAVVDLAGALWRVEAATGTAARVSDGPFGSEPSVLANGQILAIRLSSVDAPAWAAAVWVDPATGAEIRLTAGGGAESELVYRVAPLSDGSVALVRHQVGGGVEAVQLLADGTERSLATLPDAIDAEVGPDAGFVTWAARGRVLMMPTGRSDREVIELGPGTSGRFSPDGSLILVRAGNRSVVVDRTGGKVADLGPSACWVGDGRGCRS